MNHYVDIPALIAGLFVTVYGILSIPFKRVIGKSISGHYFNVINQKHGEFLALIFAPMFIIAGLFAILFSFRHFLGQ